MTNTLDIISIIINACIFLFYGVKKVVSYVFNEQLERKLKEKVKDE